MYKMISCTPARDFMMFSVSCPYINNYFLKLARTTSPTFKGILHLFWK